MPLVSLILRKWLRIEIVGLENVVTLDSLQMTVPLKEIYERVVFGPEIG